MLLISLECQKTGHGADACAGFCRVSAEEETAFLHEAESLMLSVIKRKNSIIVEWCANSIAGIFNSTDTVVLFAEAHLVSQSSRWYKYSQTHDVREHNCYCIPPKS